MFPVAVDIRPAAAGGIVAVIEAVGIRCHRPGRQQRQFNIVARGQRQRLVRRGIDDGAYFRPFRLKDGGGAGDFHRLRNLTQLHLHVDAGSLVEHQSDAGVHSALKSRRRNLHGVIAHRNAGDVVRARVVRLGGKRGSPFGIGRYNGRIFERRTAGIRNRTDDGGGYLLTERRL